LNGCETNLAFDRNTQSTALWLGAVSGDTGSDFVWNDNWGGYWYRVTVTENNVGPSGVYMSATVRLSPAAALDYDLYVYSACSGALLGSSVNGTGAVDTVNVCWNDRLGVDCAVGCDDTMDLLIHVIFYSGNTCDTFRLEVDGDTPVSGCGSACTCGGCPL